MPSAGKVTVMRVGCMLLGAGGSSLFSWLPVGAGLLGYGGGMAGPYGAELGAGARVMLQGCLPITKPSHLAVQPLFFWPIFRIRS